MRIFGINPVLEALREGCVTEIHLGTGRTRGTTELCSLAARCDVAVHRVSAGELDRLSGRGVHQGVVATIRRPVVHTVADLVRGETAPLLVVLDGIEDPRNLGAIARTADAAGATGIVLQTRRAATATGAAVKASAGALTHVRLAPVVNISRALVEIAAAGVWTVGLDASEDRSLYDLDLKVPLALVVGSEGRGLRRLVRDRCDWLASLPMQGRVSSLNVSVAAGIALFEAVRQRAAGSPRTTNTKAQRP